MLINYYSCLLHLLCCCASFRLILKYVIYAYVFLFRITGKYFDEISQDTGRYCFGVEDTIKVCS